MTATPLADLLAAVPSLNDPKQPFTYAVDGHRIVGTWDIVKATSLYPTEVTHIDKDYRLEVELDEDEHSYDYEDHESETSATLDGDGLHVEKEFFKGKTKKKEFSFEFGGVTESSKSGTDEGVSMAPGRLLLRHRQDQGPALRLPGAARLGEEEGVLQEAVQLSSVNRSPRARGTRSPHRASPVGVPVPA